MKTNIYEICSTNEELFVESNRVFFEKQIINDDLEKYIEKEMKERNMSRVEVFNSLLGYKHPSLNNYLSERKDQIDNGYYFPKFILKDKFVEVEHTQYSNFIEKETGEVIGIWTPVDSTAFDNNIYYLKKAYNVIPFEDKVSWAHRIALNDLEFRVKNWWTDSSYQFHQNMICLFFCFDEKLITKEQFILLLKSIRPYHQINYRVIIDNSTEFLNYEEN